MTQNRHLWISGKDGMDFQDMTARTTRRAFLRDAALTGAAFRLKTKPDHRAPMHPDEIIEWGEVFVALKAIDYKGVFLLEDGRGENPEQWTRLTKTFTENFVARYGPQ